MKYELQTLDEYSDEALLAELRRIADVFNGQRLTRERYDSLARVHSSTLFRRFGSWKEALDKAGISDLIAPRYRVLSREEVIQALRDFAAEYPTIPATLKAIAKKLKVDTATISGRFGRWGSLLAEVGIASAPMGRRYTEEECFENILALWTHYGRQPHFGELKHPPSTVGPKAYILRWGGWRAALSAFVKNVNDVDMPTVERNAVESITENQGSASGEIPASRSIPLALRYKILVRDRFRCVICGASPAKDLTIELHVDHIYPWSLRGQNVEENLRTLCNKCNLGKGAKVEEAGCLRS
ncbi:MAG: homing endonuclease associated repeat-containing protein [Terracidiphilus sp.]